MSGNLDAGDYGGADAPAIDEAGTSLADGGYCSATLNQYGGVFCGPTFVGVTAPGATSITIDPFGRVYDNFGNFVGMLSANENGGGSQVAGNGPDTGNNAG